MGYKNWISLILFSGIFWMVFGLFYTVYYFTGHMADWDKDWRNIMIAIMCCNFVMGPFIMCIIGDIMYSSGFRDNIKE